LTRRTFLARAAAISAGAWVAPAVTPCPSLAQPSGSAAAGEPSVPERAAMAEQARAYMQAYAIPGLSVAIGHSGRIIYLDAFGFADREDREPLTSMHLFRIASVSKPITSVAIFSLIEQSRLKLADRVFGPGALLGIDYGRPPFHAGVADITIEHLLTHTAGGWNNQHDDPMFMNPGMNHAQLIEWVLRERPLDHPPGQNYAYSNFGYCVLGRVIEKLTRQGYPTYVGTAVLKPCGITDMVIAGNTLAQRRRGEVKYYGQGDNPYGMNVTRMDSHGGWIARPADLAQFVMHVSGFAAPPDILKPETIRAMTTASTANTGYAKGWAINKADNWWHAGSLPGTATIAVRAHTGFAWAAFVNTRKAGARLEGDLDALVWKMAAQVKSWHA
jgi:CubicO group peptidase (beta-lactamase class C family)